MPLLCQCDIHSSVLDLNDGIHVQNVHSRRELKKMLTCNVYMMHYNCLFLHRSVVNTLKREFEEERARLVCYASHSMDEDGTNDGER